MVLKKKTLYWTTEAKKDLKNIAIDYKKEASKEVASKQTKGIKHYVDLLLANPLLGFKEPLLENAAKEYRSLIHGNCKIVYRIEDNTIYINRVFDYRQDPDKLKQSIRQI